MIESPRYVANESDTTVEVRVDTTSQFERTIVITLTANSGTDQCM